MKSHNDNQLKNIFDEREISPSKKSWETLSSLLDEHLPEHVEVMVSKKSSTKALYFKYTLPIAASIVLFIAVGYNFLFSGFEERIDDGITRNVTHISPVTDNNHKIENERVKTNIKSNKASIPIVKQQLLAETECLPPKTMQNQDSVVKVSSNYASSNTIQINWDNSKVKNTVVQPNELLRSVERELLQDRAAQELDKSQNKFEQIRMAVSNRNFEE